jgi:hypothetical protein
MSKAADDNRKAVVELATGALARTIVEIGVRRGRLSVLLHKIPTLEHLWLVDVWLPEKAVVRDPLKNANYVKRWAKSKPDKVTVLHMRSQRAATSFADGSIDFIYIDGDHSVKGVKSDIGSYLPKVRDGGILCGDDYDLPTVREAVDELIPDVLVHANERLWWKVVGF